MAVRKVLLFFLLLAPLAHGTSFDCRQASLSDVEKMVCNAADISAMDSALTALYRRLQEEGDKPSFGFLSDPGYPATQRQWLRKRNACRDANCIRSLYISQLEYLSKLSNEQIRLRSSEYALDLISSELPLNVFRDPPRLKVHFHRIHPVEASVSRQGSVESWGHVIHAVLSGSGSGFFHNGTGRGWCGGEPDYWMAYVEISTSNEVRRIEHLVGNSCASQGIIPVFRPLGSDEASMGIGYDWGESEEYKEFLHLEMPRDWPVRVRKFEEVQKELM